MPNIRHVSHLGIFVGFFLLSGIGGCSSFFIRGTPLELANPHPKPALSIRYAARRASRPVEELMGEYRLLRQRYIQCEAGDEPADCGHELYLFTPHSKALTRRYILMLNMAYDDFPSLPRGQNFVVRAIWKEEGEKWELEIRKPDGALVLFAHSASRISEAASHLGLGIRQADGPPLYSDLSTEPRPCRSRRIHRSVQIENLQDGSILAVAEPGAWMQIQLNEEQFWFKLLDYSRIRGEACARDKPGFMPHYSFLLTNTR